MRQLSELLPSVGPFQEKSQKPTFPDHIVFHAALDNYRQIHAMASAISIGRD
jgi:hypothetical protein